MYGVLFNNMGSIAEVSRYAVPRRCSPGTPIQLPMKESRRPPKSLDPCSCGHDRVDLQHDGLTTQYFCSACSTFLAELITGPEP